MVFWAWAASLRCPGQLFASLLLDLDIHLLAALQHLFQLLDGSVRPGQFCLTAVCSLLGRFPRCGQTLDLLSQCGNTSSGRLQIRMMKLGAQSLNLLRHLLVPAFSTRQFLPQSSSRLLQLS